MHFSPKKLLYLHFSPKGPKKLVFKCSSVPGCSLNAVQSQKFTAQKILKSHTARGKARSRSQGERTDPRALVPARRTGGARGRCTWACARSRSRRERADLSLQCAYSRAAARGAITVRSLPARDKLGGKFLGLTAFKEQLGTELHLNTNFLGPLGLKCK